MPLLNYYRAYINLVGPEKIPFPKKVLPGGGPSFGPLVYSLDQSWVVVGVGWVWEGGLERGGALDDKNDGLLTTPWNKK